MSSPKLGLKTPNSKLKRIARESLDKSEPANRCKCGYIAVRSFNYETKETKNHCTFCDQDVNSFMGSYVNVIYGGNKNANIKFNYNFGIEIECGINHDTFDLLNTQKRIGPKEILEPFIHSKTNLKKMINTDVNLLLSTAIGKSDSSIRMRGKKKVEIASPILNGDGGIKYIEDLLNLLNPKFNATTGMHVHVGIPTNANKTYFTRRVGLLSQIIDFFVLMPMLHKSRIGNRYCTNIYSSYYQRRDYFRFIKNLFQLVNNGAETITIEGFDSYICGHYNMTSASCHYNTIEFRHMRGNRNIKYISKMINHYMAVIDICAENTKMNLIKFLTGIMRGTAFYNEIMNSNDGDLPMFACNPAFSSIFESATFKEMSDILTKFLYLYIHLNNDERKSLIRKYIEESELEKSNIPVTE